MVVAVVPGMLFLSRGVQAQLVILAGQKGPIQAGNCQRGILTTASLQSPTGIGISGIYSEALSACNSNLWFVGHKTPSFPGRGKKKSDD